MLRSLTSQVFFPTYVGRPKTAVFATLDSFVCIYESGLTIHIYTLETIIGFQCIRV